MNPPLSPGEVKVVLVEDHQMFREWLGQMLSKDAGFAICGEADNICSGLELIKCTRPDIVIVDLTLKGSSGLELIKDLKAHSLKIPVLVLSMHDEVLYAERVLRAGANGYISKHEATSTLSKAILHVLSGRIYLSEKMTATLLQRLTSGASADAASLGSLTDRELEVFQLIGRGYNGPRIAELLHLGESTVETYRARIKEKLQVKSAAELYTHAARWVQEHGA